MSAAAIIAISIGVIYLVCTGLMLVKRDAVHQALRAFPRHSLAAKILTAIAIGWFGWLLFKTNFGRFEYLKPGIYVGVPFAYYCLVKHLEELLSVRALGGIFIIAGAPLLDAIRWHDSNWRWIITVFVYVMIVKGMILVVSPYRFRHWVEWAFKGKGREKLFAYTAGFCGILYAAVGLSVL
jgi:hypothetical protein